MSKSADAFIERLEKIRNAENTFFFDGDSIVLVPKDLENMNKLREFEAARIQGIENNLREQIALEIENDMYVLLPNCTSEEAMFIRDQAAKIARGK